MEKLRHPKPILRLKSRDSFTGRRNPIFQWIVAFLTQDWGRDY